MSRAARQRHFSPVANRVSIFDPRRWQRSSKRTYTRLLASWGPGNGPVPVRNLVTLLGGIIVVATALSIPIGYGIIGYLKEASALTYKAELSAARAAQYIYAPDAPWRYDTDQLGAMSEIRTPTAAPIVQRIVDAHNDVRRMRKLLEAFGRERGDLGERLAPDQFRRKLACDRARAAAGS